MKVIYEDIAVGADEDATFTATNKADFSDVSQLATGIPVQNAMTLELNQIGLDGSFVVSDKTQAYWSSVRSGEDCLLSSPPVITINFDAQYTSLGLSLEMDTLNFCTLLHIAWYRGVEVVAENDFTPDTANYFCQQTAEAYNKIVITFKRTNLPFRYIRLGKIIFGVNRTFLSDEIRSGTILCEISPTSEELSTNTADWTLDSKENVDFIFQKKQRMMFYDKERFVGAFYIKSSVQNAVNLHDISCVDAIGTLEDSEYPAKYLINKNAYDLIADICQPFTIEIDESLKTKKVSGVLLAGTKRYALQQVLFAICAVCNTTASDKIRIFIPDTTVYNIDNDRIFIGGSIQTDDIVSSVSLTYRTFQTDEPPEGTEYTQYEVDGVKYYGVITTITKKNPLVVSTDIQNDITVTEVALITQDNAQAVLDNLYDYHTRRKLNKFTAILGDEVPSNVVKAYSYDGTHTGILEKLKIRISNLTIADMEVRG